VLLPPITICVNKAPSSFVASTHTTALNRIMLLASFFNDAGTASSEI
jgi:hypothetical protein